MNRFRSGMVPLFALLALAACNSEPTEDIRGDISQLVASPTQLFIEVGETKTVTVGAVDQQGNPLDFNYEVTSTGAGITVERDLSYLPIFVDDSTLQAPATGPQFQFVVEGTAYTTTSFTVSAGGEDVVIPVQVIPQAGLAATFDDDTVDLGQVVTLTAPAGVTFADTATLSLGTDSASLANPITILTQDASTITFIPPPSVNSPVTVNGVISGSTPDLVYAPATQTALVTPLIDTVDVTYSDETPALGQSVTMTVTDPLIKLAADSLIFPGQLPGREGDPQNVLVALDSASLTFDTPPNIDGSGTVVNFLFPGGYLRALPTLPIVTAPSVGTELNATFDDQEPALLQAVTLTAPAGFSFAADVAVTIGGNAAIIQSVAGDGSSVTLVPIPGSAGVAAVDGVIPDAAPANNVIMNTVQTVTVPAITPLAGTESPETAPELAVPTSGNSTVLNDAGSFDGEPTDCCFGFHPRMYKIVITAPTTLNITIDWFTPEDLGVYVTQADGITPFPSPADNFADAGGGGVHPETVTINFAPGTYLLNAVNFSGSNPPFFQLTIENP
jgi:hypothetical protein